MGHSRRTVLKQIGALAGASFLPLAAQSQSVEIDRVKFDNDPEDLSELINLFDFEKMAEAKMSKMAWEFFAGGAADEITVRWNRQALDNIKIRPRVLHDVDKLDTKVSLFGYELAYPILIAPTSYHRLIHPEGELATARGAGAASTIYVVSTTTTTVIEEITKVATQPLWFQLYVNDDRSLTKDLVQKVEDQGCQAICVTVDSPVGGARNRQQRAKFKLPPELKTPYGVIGASSTTPHTKPLTWKDIEWLKSFTKLPVLLKGILNPDDAEQAIHAGASGIIVSNHGGRNLDTVPATIEVLPHIVDKAGGKIPILMDGGIRRGTDILKAIALGANAVLVGRPICFGLACGGAEGVTKVLTILRKEFELAMALSGRSSISEIDRSLIWKDA